mgnify:CR=1 FL=1
MQDHLDKGSIADLAVWVRPGAAEAEVFACWKEAARRQAEEEAAALRESLTAVEGEGGGGSAVVPPAGRRP